MSSHNTLNTLRDFTLGNGSQGQLFSLPALEEEGVGNISRLPVSIRIVLESVLRNCDGKKVSEENVRELAQWQPKSERTAEIPFVVARIVLQDFTGVPLLVDLAAMRSAVSRLGKNSKIIEPLVPVEVDDHALVPIAGLAGGVPGARADADAPEPVLVPGRWVRGDELLDFHLHELKLIPKYSLYCSWFVLYKSLKGSSCSIVCPQVFPL